MRERPIIFSGPMVRAILDGRKTQTRRVVKPQPFDDCDRIEVGVFNPEKADRFGEAYPGRDTYGAYSLDGEWCAACLYGAPGDRLWVRETWRLPNGAPKGWVDYRADDTRDGFKWRSPIHMPRWASRITLEVVSVRVERVQAIRLPDVAAEGIPQNNERGWDTTRGFAQTWDAINAKRGYSWASNPWVWCVEFGKIDAKGGAA